MGQAARHSFKESTDYDLIYDGNTYPPKAILGLAADRVVGRPLTSDEFTGGDHSSAFAILRDLGFLIQRKVQGSSPQNAVSMSLRRYQLYSRKAIANFFEPNYEFKRGSGRWGISGIIESPSDSGDFVFMVTLGAPKPGNPYQDALTLDGFLIWESQTQHSFNSRTIKKLIGHQGSENNIHLFLRSSGVQDYVYMGLLDYSSHDEIKQNPVHFVWRIQNWDLVENDLKRLSLDFRPALNPAYSPIASTGSVATLIEVPRPALYASSKKERKKMASGGCVDWAAKDAKNRLTGLVGEKLVVQHEIEGLKAANRPDLANMVEHVALTDATAGYDIRSYGTDGSPKRIEVKTTEGPIRTPFYISINEVLASRDDPDSYWIYRLFDFGKSSQELQFYLLHGDVEECCELVAVNFRAQPLLENEQD